MLAERSLMDKLCPCGSGRQAQDCCLLPNGMWYKAPSKILPPPPITGISNSKCYMSLLCNCSKERSGEHYVSQSVLYEIGSPLKVSGLSWQQEKVQEFSVKSLKSRVLCKRHNNALSHLDTEAGRFFKTIREIASFSTPESFFLFNGKDIERWMLKTLYGLLASKSLQARIGQRIIAPIDTKCLDLLFDKRPWNNQRGISIRTERDYTVVPSNSLYVSPVLDNRTSKVYGMRFTLRGFDFLLATTDFSIEAGTSLYRPKQIILEKNGKQKIIEFTWETPSHNQIAIFQWTGKLDSYEAWYNHGNVCNKEGHYKEAITAYKKAIEMKPDCYEAWNNLGFVYENQDQHKEAIAAYQKAIAIRPDSHEALCNLGNAYNNQGEYKQAITTYGKALDIKSDFHRAWYNQGNIFVKQQAYKKAITAYLKAIEIHSEFHEAWHNLGEVYETIGEYDEAITAYLKALKLFPDSHETLCKLGNLCRTLGRLEEAKQYLQRALTIFNKINSPSVHMVGEWLNELESSGQDAETSNRENI